MSTRGLLNSIYQKALKSKISVLFLIWLAIIGINSNRTGSITGPFIFADEAEYLRIAREFAAGHKFQLTQYAPFYPWLISFFLRPGRFLQDYERIRIFNVIIFSSVFIPYFILARNFFSDFKRQVFVAAMIALMPWSSMVAMMWAEPVFYFLYSASICLVFYALQDGKPYQYLLTGVAIVFTVLTKQAGVVIAIAFSLTLIGQVVVGIVSRRKGLVALILVNLPLGLVLLALEAFKIGASPSGGIGYKTITDSIGNNFVHLLFSWDFYSTFGYQLSYFFVALLFLPALGFCVGLSRLNAFSAPIRSFFVFIGLGLIGIFFMSSLFFNSFQSGYGLPNEPTLENGRYMAPLLAAAFFLGFWVVDSQWSRFNFRFGAISAILGTLLIYFFTPLLSATPIGISTSFDVLYVRHLFRGGSFPDWTAAEHFAFSDAYGPWFTLIAIAIFGIFLGLMALRWRWPVYVVLSLAFIFTSAASVDLVDRLGDICFSENQLYRKILNQKISLSEIGLLKEAKLSPFMASFWFGNEEVDKWLRSPEVLLDGVAGRASSWKWLIARGQPLSDCMEEFHWGDLSLCKLKN